MSGPSTTAARCSTVLFSLTCILVSPYIYNCDRFIAPSIIEGVLLSKGGVKRNPSPHPHAFNPPPPPPGFTVTARTGTRFHPILNSWSLTSDESVNYFMLGRKSE
jgi:hypothetical protein